MRPLRVKFEQELRIRGRAERTTASPPVPASVTPSLAPACPHCGNGARLCAQTPAPGRPFHPLPPPGAASGASDSRSPMSFPSFPVFTSDQPCCAPPDCGRVPPPVCLRVHHAHAGAPATPQRAASRGYHIGMHASAASRNQSRFHTPYTATTPSRRPLSLCIIKRPSPGASVQP